MALCHYCRPVPGALFRKAAAAVVLIALGLFCCGMFRVLSQSAHHAYATSGKPPSTVDLTAGKQYILSVHGGTKALLSRGVNITSPECTWSVDNTESQALTVTPAGADTKATNAVATFIAPFTGHLHIECTNFGGIYVDDANDAGADNAGWYLLAGALALAIGGGLGVSAMREASLRRSEQRTPRDDDEVETFVDGPFRGFGHDEVGRQHRDDVLS